MGAMASAARSAGEPAAVEPGRGVRTAATGPPKEKQQTVVRTTKKVGRNDPCPCGSGKKYKRCCGKGQ